MHHGFLDREFVSQWSSGTVFVGKNTAVQSLKHLWFSAKYPLFKVSRDPQWKGCLLIVFTNILTSCLNIQTLLSQKPCDSVWLLLFPSLQNPVLIMTLQISSLLQQPLVQNVEKGKTWTKQIFKLGSLSVPVWPNSTQPAGGDPRFQPQTFLCFPASTQVCAADQRKGCV